MDFSSNRIVRSCLVSLILTPFARTKWLAQIFVDCNRFNKGELNEVLNGPFNPILPGGGGG